MILKLCYPIYISFIVTASILLNNTSNPTVLILFALLFLASKSIEKKIPQIRPLQIVFLALFQWSSQLNWCYPIYLILMVERIIQIQKLLTSIRIALCFVAIYSIIRLTYSPLTMYNLLLVLMDSLSYLILVLFIRYVVIIHWEKRRLEEQTHQLSKFDPLTGLFNHHEFLKQLGELLQKRGDDYLLFLIDCADFKSMNLEQGYQAGNRILQKVAQFFRDRFPDAILIARYGGDEFSLVLKRNEDTFQRFTHLVEGELPNLYGGQITYGYSLFPADGETQDELLAVLEERLFQQKRSNWLKREEQMIRTEKLKVIGQLAAGMAHEIRNPLTAVKGFLQIAKGQDFNIKPWYEIIMREIERMNYLTSEFLQFTKPHPTSYEKRTVQQLLQSIIPLLESEALLLGHRFVYEESPEPMSVYMERDKMVQVLLNMVKNSLEAMHEPGCVTIRVYPDKTYGIIEIEDTGEGILESKLGKLFEPFYTTKDHGTGLGLYICHGIIENHGGSIQVLSTVGSGTTFKVSLPLIQFSDS